MYILVKPDQSTVYPYSVNQLMRDNPNTSFRTDMSDIELAPWSVFPVIGTPRPQYDATRQRIIDSTPSLVDNAWYQVWQVEDLSEREIMGLSNNRQLVINEEQREFLASTDWYVIRKLETGIEIPVQILTAREAARSAIVEIEVR